MRLISKGGFGLLAILAIHSFSASIWAQPACILDPCTDPVGSCDTLKATRLDLAANSAGVVSLVAVHDEALSGIGLGLLFGDSISPLDVVADSIVIHPDMNCPGLYFPIIDSSRQYFSVVIACSSGAIAAGSDTICKVYFRTGPAWPAGQLVPIVKLDSVPLEFTTNEVNPQDIFPIYCPTGTLDVQDKNPKEAGLPKDFRLSQNYPNPFNAKTLIEFTLPEADLVRLEIFNVLGRKIRTLANEKLSAGYKQVIWDGTDDNGNSVGSGIYFYRLKSSKYMQTNKMTLLK